MKRDTAPILSVFCFRRRNGQVFNRLETVFHYKQSAQPRYVLALDKSSPMDERVR